MIRPLLLVLLLGCAATAELRVDPAAPGPGEDGATWASAYRTLGAALAAAHAGDELWLAAGTYTPGTAVTSTFTVPDGVALYGGFVGGETLRSQRRDDPGLCVLSGEIGAATASDNVHRVVTLAGSAVLDTLTVTRGYWANPLSSVGSAIYTYQYSIGKSVTVRRCRIIDNWAGRANAVSLSQVATILDRCEFTANHDTLSTIDSANGAVVLLEASRSATVSACVFTGNAMAATTGAASALLIDGYAWAGQSFTVASCVFAANSHVDAAVRLYNGGTGTAVALSACTFTATANPGRDAVGATALRGCLLATAPATAPAVMEGCWIAAVDGDPRFTDAATPAGADGVWGTADDGLILGATSPARGAARMATASADPALPAADLRGLLRPQGRDPEPGAYEIDEGDAGPRATAATAAADEDALTPIALAGTDPDGDALSAWITALPAHGTLWPTVDGSTASGPALAAGDLPWHVPHPGRVVLFRSQADDHGAGRGTFSFLVDDGRVQSHPATCTVDVAAVNDVPTLDLVGDRAVGENSGATTVLLTGISAGTPALTAADPGLESQVLTVTATSSAPGVVPNPVVVYTSPATSAQLVFAPLPSANGSAVISVRVRDDGGTARGGADTLVRTFTVTVQPANDPPTIPPIPDRTLAEDETSAALTTVTIAGITAGPADENGQTLEVTAISDNPAVVGIASTAYDPATGTARVRLAPVADANGSARVFVGVLDNAGGSAAQVFTVTVTPVADDPRLTVGPNPHCPVGSGTVILPTHLLLSDPDGTAANLLTYTIRQLPGRGELRWGTRALALDESFTQADIDAQRISYWSIGGGAIPLDAVGFDFRDDSGRGGSSVLTIELEGAFVPMLFLPAAAGTWTDGTAPLPCATGAVVVDGDPDPWIGGSITASIGAGAAAGDRLSLLHQGVGQGQVGIDGATVSFGGLPVGTWRGGSGGQALVVSFTTAAATQFAVDRVVAMLAFDNPGGNPGSATRAITVVINDGSAGASQPQTTTVAVVPMDDPPRIATTWLGTLPGLTRESALAASDPDSPALTWSLGASPAEVAVTLLDPATGLLRLVPRPGWTGTAQIAATVSDGVNPPATAAVALVVAGFDAARPLAAADAPLEVVAGEVLTLDVPWDAGPGDSALAFGFAGSVPAGLTVQAIGARRARLQWAVPADQAAGFLSCLLLADDPATRSTGVLPVLVGVRARPQGSN